MIDIITDTSHRYCCELKSHSGEVYHIYHYVIKFVSELQQVSAFLRVFWFPPPIILTATIYEIFLKVVLNSITPNPDT